MPVPSNPIGRRQVLKALAAIPVLGGSLDLSPRPERPASYEPATVVDGPASVAGRRRPQAGQALIGVL